MNPLIGEYINILFKFPFHSSIPYLGQKGLIPVLNLLEKTTFPKPIVLEFSGKRRNSVRKKRINTYLDPALLEILEPNGNTGTHISINATHSPNTLFHIFISQKGTSEQLSILIGLDLIKEWNTTPIKSFFLDLLTLFPQVYLAQCFFALAYTSFYTKHIEGKHDRSHYFPFLVWLQYIGSRELSFQGGRDAFDTNPLLKTTPLHEGLVVEVGESLYDIFTEEGEDLLVQATLSLPPVQYPSKSL